MQTGFKMTPVAMVVSDPTLPDCPLIYVNAAFEKLTGFPAVEVLGRNCRFMQGPLTDPNDVTRLRVRSNGVNRSSWIFSTTGVTGRLSGTV